MILYFRLWVSGPKNSQAGCASLVYLAQNYWSDTWSYV